MRSPLIPAPSPYVARLVRIDPDSDDAEFRPVVAGRFASAGRRRDDAGFTRWSATNGAVLAALRPVDGTTGMALRGLLDISGARARIVRNRSGLYVIHEWSRLAAHASAFDAPPALPAPGSERLELVLARSRRRYLPRLASIDLPRDPRARRRLALRGDGRALHPSASAGLGTTGPQYAPASPTTPTARPWAAPCCESWLAARCSRAG